MTIDSKGNVNPCVFLPVTFGNIMEEYFRSIYRRMRERIHARSVRGARRFRWLKCSEPRRASILAGLPDWILSERAYSNSGRLEADRLQIRARCLAEKDEQNGGSRQLPHFAPTAVACPRRYNVGITPMLQLRKRKCIFREVLVAIFFDPLKIRNRFFAATKVWM